MKNVLIISYHFPPTDNIAAKRYGYMARYFQEQDWVPWILTTHSSVSSADDEWEGRVLRIGRNPQAGQRVDQLHAVNAIHGWPKLVHGALSRLHFRLRSVDRYFFTWYREVLSQTDWIMAKAPKPDLIVASYGPAVALWLGRKLADLYDVPWVADYRDLGALHPLDRSRLSQVVDIQIEKRLLASADQLITVSGTLANMLERTYGKACAVVYNGWDPDDWRPECAETNPVEELPPAYVYYAGSLYRHQLPSMQMLLQVLKERGEPAFVLRSLGPESLEAEIRRYADRIQAGHLLRILPACPMTELYREAQQAKANLVFDDLDRRQEWSKGTLTGKLFTLLPLRPPILCVARADSDIGGILRTTNKGWLAASPAEIRESLRLLRAPGRLFGGNANIGCYTRRRQAESMVKIFDAVYAGR